MFLLLFFVFGSVVAANFISDPWPKCSILSTVEAQCTAQFNYTSPTATILDVCRDFGRWSMIRHQVPVKRSDGLDCLFFVWSFQVFSIGVYCDGDTGPTLLDSYDSLVDLIAPGDFGPFALYYKADSVAPGSRANERSTVAMLRLSQLVHSEVDGWQLRVLHEAVPWPLELLPRDESLAYQITDVDDFSLTFLGRLGRGDGRLVFFINGNWLCPVLVVNPDSGSVLLSPGLESQWVPLHALKQHVHGHAALDPDQWLVVIVTRFYNKLQKDTRGNPTYIIRLKSLRVPPAGSNDWSGAFREIVGPDKVEVLGVAGEDVVVLHIPRTMPPLAALGSDVALPGPACARFLLRAVHGGVVGTRNLDDVMIALQFNSATGRWHSAVICGGIYESGVPCPSLTGLRNTQRMFAMSGTNSIVILPNNNIVTVYRPVDNRFCTFEVTKGFATRWRGVLSPSGSHLVLIADGSSVQPTVLTDGVTLLTLGSLPDCSTLCLGKSLHFIGNSAIMMATEEEVAIVVSLPEWIEKVENTPLAAPIACAVARSAVLFLTAVVKGSRLSNGDFLMLVDRPDNFGAANNYCNLQRIDATLNPSWMRPIPLLSAKEPGTVSQTECIRGFTTSQVVAEWPLTAWEIIEFVGESSFTTRSNNGTELGLSPDAKGGGLSTIAVALMSAGGALLVVLLCVVLLVYFLVSKRRRQWQVSSYSASSSTETIARRHPASPTQGRRSTHSRSRSGTDTGNRARPHSISLLNRQSSSRLLASAMGPVSHVSRGGSATSGPTNNTRCPHCNKQYPSPDDLALHIAKRHDQQESYSNTPLGYTRASYSATPENSSAGTSWTTVPSVPVYVNPDPPTAYSSRGLRQPDQQVQYVLDGLESPPSMISAPGPSAEPSLTAPSQAEPSHSNVFIPYNSPLRVDEFEKFQK